MGLIFLWIALGSCWFRAGLYDTERGGSRQRARGSPACTRRRWDGKTEPDPVGMYQGRAARKREQERRESGLDAEGYLEAKGLQMSASLQDNMQAAAGSIQNISRPDKDGNIRNHGMQRPAGLDEAVTKYEHAREAQDAKKAEEARNALKDMIAPGVDAALKEASKMIPHLERVIDKTCAAVPGCSKMMRKGTKKAARIIEKAINDYQGDASRVIDMIGGTIIIPNGGSYVAVIDAIKEAAGEDNIVKLKKFNFNSAKPSYHDIKVSVRFPSGIIGEIIVVSEFINDAKFNRGGHLVYEVRRELEPYADNYKEVFEAIHSLNELSAAIYDAEATAEDLERSKAKAASSLQCLRSLLPKMDISEGVKGVSNSPDALLNRIKPASVSSTAALISLQTQNISNDDVPQESGDVNKKNKNFSASEQDDEIKAIREAAIADNTFMKAPNGVPTNLTERQWLQVRTRAFKAWFGDWENDSEHASKVLDENGEPLVVYHGTPNHGFTVFDAKRQGERDPGDFGKGFYFTPSKEYAKTYSLPGYLNFGGDESKVYAVFVNMREPLHHNAYWGSPGYVDEEAHDGIIVGNDKYEELPYSHPKNFSEIVAVKPNQIKSATENRGTFDGRNADITFSEMSADEVYSAWSARVQHFIQNPPPSGSSGFRRDMTVCPMPAVFRMLGLPQLDIVVGYAILAKVIGADEVYGNGMRNADFYRNVKNVAKHKFKLADLPKIPGQLADPVCIAESDIHGRLEVVTEMMENGHNVLVAIEIGTGAPEGNSLKVHRIVSLYGKERVKQLLTHPMRYWNEEKARAWLENGGLQLPTANQLKAGTGGKVLTPADLVKYKNQHNLNFSQQDMEMASAHALAVLEARADEAYAAQLAREFRRKVEAWSLARVRGDEKEGRLGRGAKLFGELMALVDAAELTLGAAANTGRLHFLLAWAAAACGNMAKFMRNVYDRVDEEDA